MTGCLSARGTCPFNGSFCKVPFFLLLSDDEEEDEVEDEDEDEDEDETAADHPCRDPLVAFLAVLGDPPGVTGIDLSESSLMSIIL